MVKVVERLSIVLLPTHPLIAETWVQTQKKNRYSLKKCKILEQDVHATSIRLSPLTCTPVSLSYELALAHLVEWLLE